MLHQGFPLHPHKMSIKDDNMVDIDFKQPDHVPVGHEERTREGLILPNTTTFNLMVLVYMVLLTMTSFALLVLVPLTIYSYIKFEIMGDDSGNEGLMRFMLLLSAGVVLIVGVNNVIGWIALRTMLMKYLYLNVVLKSISLITTILFASLMAKSAVWLCLLVQVPILCAAFGIMYEMRMANRDPRYPIESLIVTQ